MKITATVELVYGGAMKNRWITVEIKNHSVVTSSFLSAVGLAVQKATKGKTDWVHWNMIRIIAEKEGEGE